MRASWPRARSAGRRCREARLELDDAVLLDPPARGVERGLGIETVVDDPPDHLEVALRLHRAAHDAERPEQLTLLEQHARDDRVERSLRRRELVRDDPGTRLKPAPRFWRTTPVPGATTPEPNDP